MASEVGGKAGKGWRGAQKEVSKASKEQGEFLVSTLALPVSLLAHLIKEGLHLVRDHHLDNLVDLAERAREGVLVLQLHQALQKMVLPSYRNLLVVVRHVVLFVDVPVYCGGGGYEGGTGGAGRRRLRLGW
jgi:hypothetical protein